MNFCLHTTGHASPLFHLHTHSPGPLNLVLAPKVHLHGREVAHHERARADKTTKAGRALKEACGRCGRGSVATLGRRRGAVVLADRLIILDAHPGAGRERRDGADEADGAAFGARQDLAAGAQGGGRDGGRHGRRGLLRAHRFGWGWG